MSNNSEFDEAHDGEEQQFNLYVNSEDEEVEEFTHQDNKRKSPGRPPI